jgi:hypothetical protein
MWISVKRQIAVVTFDSDIVWVLWKMPHIFTNAECADTRMLYVYGIWDGSASAAVEEYHRRFAVRRNSDHRVFSKVFNTLRECGTLPSARVSSEQARQQHVEEQENILEIVQRSPTTYLGNRSE